MNDFTKEELQDLYAAIRHCYKQHIDLPSDTDTERFSYCLMEKIDFLIDNYCEHDWDYGCRASYRCRSCGEMKEDE